MLQPGFFGFLNNALPACPRLETPLRVWLKPLDKALKYSGRKKGRRPPYDPALMLKILILQALYSLSDDQMPMTKCQ